MGYRLIDSIFDYLFFQNEFFRMLGAENLQNIVVTSFLKRKLLPVYLRAIRLFTDRTFASLF